MTSLRPPRPDQQGGRVEGRQQAVAALRERAAAQVCALVTGEDWAAWLRMAARLPGWSFTNVLLIAAQRPTATLVAGYQAWQEDGRRVRKGEPGIQVIVEPRLSSGTPGIPAPIAEVRAGTGARPPAPTARRTYVWDISQTDGPARSDLPMPLSPGGGSPPGLWDALVWLARREGLSVGRGPVSSLDSATSWTPRRILIRPDLSTPDAARALIHELGHVLAHGSLAHLPGASTAGCRGVRKLEADSVAFTLATRLGMDTSAYSWPYVASWAGSDPRARPEETIRATGERISAAATTIAAHLDVTLFAKPPEASPDLVAVPERARGIELAREPTAQPIPAAITGVDAEARVAVPEPPAPDLGRVLADAERFYVSQLKRSWAPGYLAARGLSQESMTRWRVGYAPAGWTTLLRHLRDLGHNDGVIETAGLARRSSRGTLIDYFRDRVMLAIRGEHGMVIGFIGRTSPNAGTAVPKYLNSPETPAYTKGDVLFGLHEARDQLAHGAVPVIVEGPFDAIAVTAADPSRYAGLAPCGTALTGRQAAALGRVAAIGQTGVLVALDGDRAGREAAIRAYGTLLPVTGKTTAAILPTGSDPAGILQTDGPAALSDALQHQIQPLARVVIDAHLDSWASQLDHAEGQLHAMRSAASLIASLLSAEAARRVLQVTGGRLLATLDDDLRPIADPKLPVIARLLSANVICQIVRVADRLGSHCSEVTAEVANAVSTGLTSPKRLTAQVHRTELSRDTNPADLAAGAFPGSPSGAGGGTGAPRYPRTPPHGIEPGSRSRPASRSCSFSPAG
jgi:DNA primase